MYMNFTCAELSSREVRCLGKFKMGNSMWVGLDRNNGCRRVLIRKVNLA